MPLVLTDLPAELLQHIAVRIQLAYHIARAAPTCRVISVAARNAIIARAFSPEVVTLAGHARSVACVAAAPDGRVVTGSDPHRGNLGSVDDSESAARFDSITAGCCTAATFAS